MYRRCAIVKGCLIMGCLVCSVPLLVCSVLRLRSVSLTDFRFD